MELFIGFIRSCWRPCHLRLPPVGTMSAILILGLLLGQQAAGLSFNQRLRKMMRQPSQHGNKVPRWDPDPETKLREKRALENSTAELDGGVDSETLSREYGEDYESSENCRDHLKASLEDYIRTAYKGPVCDIIDARNSAYHLKDLQNCVIVNGFVQLLFMHDLTEEELRKYRFPKLRVITDYLLIFRLYNLRSLRYMFPNLAVIGGRELFKDYAIVIFENPHLKEIGLGNLQIIKRGGVRIEKNPMLCYLSTINWDRLGQQGEIQNELLPNKKDIFRDNRDEEQCINQCGDNAGCEKEDGRELCWGLDLCQKKLCPKECPDSCREDGSCDCHEQCLGGCTRSNDPRACIACRDKYFNGTCLSECPPGKYLIFDWLCIDKLVCQQYDWNFYENECRRYCPPGYKPNRTDCMSICTKCFSDCGQVCPGDHAITDEESIDEVMFCSEIEGTLTISINGGSEVVERLDKDLANLRQIGSLIVRRSFPLVTLSFLKNVKRITGMNKEQGIYSIYILENQNLKELWNFTESGMERIPGKAFFHFNPQLCLQEVHKVEYLTEEREDDKDISDTTNGDKAICDFIPIEILEIQVYEDPYVLIWWENIKVKDDRTLIGYQVYYKESTYKNAKKNEGVDACRLNSWTIVDKAKPDDAEDEFYPPENGTNFTLIAERDPGKSSKLLSHLKAYTQYAFYVQAYTTSTAERGAASEIQYFMTKPAKPSNPRNLRSTGTTTSSIDLVWDAPLTPSGVITHYIVEWSLQKEEDLPSIRAVDTCKPGFGKAITNIPRKSTSEPTDSDASKEKKPSAKDECLCECEQEKISKQAAQDAQESADFENFLQNSIFTIDEDFPAAYPLEDEEMIYRNEDYNDTRYRRSIIKRSIDLVDNSTVITSTTGRRISTSPFSATTDSTTVTENKTTPVPEDPKYKKKRAVVEGMNITLTGLHHYSEYSIQVYACNHASDPRSWNDSTYKIKEEIEEPFESLMLKKSKYVECSIEAMLMKRTSALKSADSIPPGSVKTVTLDKGTSEETTSLYWLMPEDPNAYIRTFTIEVTNTETEKPIPPFCAHVNSSIQDVMSFNFSKHLIPPGKYRAKVRAISLAGEGEWSEEVFFEEKDHTRSYQQTVLIVGITVPLVFAIVIIGLLAYFRTRKKPIDSHSFYTDYNPEYQRYVYIPDEYEVDAEKVTILEEIGHGNFGKVFAGIAKSVVRGEAETKVAIKKLHENAMPARRFEFLKEASMMKAFNAHHVVRLLGVISRTSDPMVIMEFMEKGDLKSYLRSRRENSEENPQHIPPPSLQEKLQMAAEIADGMAYLAAFKFVHRDLAARNCLVSGEGTVKIGDFGLTRDIYETDYYRKESRGFLPIRWMAPESLKDGVFDSRSDVWSYGVVLWELATLAEQPYQGLPHDEVTKFVIDGGYMEKPRNCPKRLYDLMTYCWEFNPKMRPIFLEIVQELYRDVTDEFKELCFYGKNEQTGLVEEEEGQFLLPHEHPDGVDAMNTHNHLGTSARDNYPDGNVVHSNRSAGDGHNFRSHKHSAKPEQKLLPVSTKTDSEERWLLASDNHISPRMVESPDTTTTTAPTTPISSGDRRTAANHGSTESLYENDARSSQSRDHNLRDSGTFLPTYTSGTPKDEDKDPLVSYKHLNGGHKLADLDLDHESGVDDSSTVSPSNPPTPTEVDIVLPYGGNDETTCFLRSTGSSSC